MATRIRTGCVVEECSVRFPTFGFPGQRATRCKRHKEEGMIDVANKNKRCAHQEGCTKQPNFGFLGENPSRCSIHRLEGMTCTTVKKCDHSVECGRRAYFGVSGKAATRCFDHKTEDMINVASKKCIEKDCQTQPVFGHRGERPLYCAVHKKDGMEDVVNGRCSDPSGCKFHPSFGYAGGKRERCFAHKLEGMVSMISKKCDHPDGCETRPSFGYSGERASRCSVHRMADMVDVVSKRCKGAPGSEGCPFLSIITSGRYSSDLCSCCDQDETRHRRRKKTEERCFSELSTKYGIVPTSREYRVQYDCTTISTSRYCFIDGVFYDPNIVILLEIDELAHSGYDRNCEERRMQDATAAFRTSGEQRPIYWIRFNPDEPGGNKAGIPKKHKERCALVASSIRAVLENPRDGVEYVNY